MPSATRTALNDRVQRLLTALVGIPSVSGSEDGVRTYIAERLGGLGLAPAVDVAGNLVAALPGTLPGTGAPLLLNAHMDRVPPGLGHVPRVVRGRMHSDGATNLGADDAAGIAIILLTVEEVVQRALPHPPLVLLFTVGEEVGLRGAAAFDPEPWHVQRGIVFDNAGAPGEVVTRASTYIAFDAVLRGVGGHPGKDLRGTLSALEVLRSVDLPLGRWDGGATRVSIGTIQGGTARNAIPSEIRLAGEIRTLRGGEQVEALLSDVARRFAEAATRLGGAAECAFEPHGAGYAVPEEEPLLRAWQAAWHAVTEKHARGITSFIGSDANALRPRLPVFTVSTGVVDEHTVRESIALAPLAQLVRATVRLLEHLSRQDTSPVPSQEPVA